MASACSAVAQTPPLAVGDPAVSGRHIRPYANEWKMIHRGLDGADRPAGRWIDTLEVPTDGDHEILRRTQVTYNAAGNLVSRQVHIVDRRTMAPLRSHLSRDSESNTWTLDPTVSPGSYYPATISHFGPFTAH